MFLVYYDNAKTKKCFTGDNMLLPEKADFNWQSVLQKALTDNTINIHEIVAENSEIAAELKAANTSYEYWDKVRYTLLPENISPELFWSVVKFRRSGLYAEKIKIGIHIFKYLINPEILKKLYFIEKFNAYSSFALDKQNEYRANAAMEEATASSRLEGADITAKAAKEILRTNASPSNESESMVINNYKALVFMERNTDKELSLELIKQLYRIIADSQSRDVFRQEGHSVRVVDIRDDAVLYEPPKSADIETLLLSLCDYINADTDTNPVIKAAALHFLFAYIHPFRDGNGRAARILFYWYALKKGLGAFKYLPVSKTLRLIPSLYAKAFLYTEMDENDLTYFINFQLDVLAESVNSFEEYVRQSELSKPEEKISCGFGVKLNLRHKSILRDFALNRQQRNIEYFKNKLGIVYETARKDMMYLAKKGFLSKRKKSKEFVYSLSKKSLQQLQSGEENPAEK